MRRSSNFERWKDPLIRRDTESSWRRREVVNPVTTRSGLCTANPVELSSGSEEERDTPIKREPETASESEEEEEFVMAAHDPDPEIGSLNVHLDGEPPTAIVVTPEQAAINIKPCLLAVMPHFYGRKLDCPYEFLHEFCKLCGIQKKPNGSSDEDYRLRAIPFALKGEANTWFLRLRPNSIRIWSEFRLAFLDYFFPATKTNALKKEITGATQDFDETLSQYWARFKGLLDACPNNRMSEAEIYSSFYEGMIPESKDLVNSSSGGDFSRIRVSEAKRIIGRLVHAKKAYDDPRTNLLRRGSASSVVVQSDDKMDARIDKLEKAILSAIEKNKQPALPEKVSVVTGPEEQCQYYGPQGDIDYMAQVNAAGSWNPEKQMDAPWRDHPNFRWGEDNPNQPNWSGRNQQNPHLPHSNQNSTYVPPH